MDDPDDFIVKAEDVRAVGYCVSGLRGFLEDRGISVRDFIRDGLPAKTFIGFKDARSDRVVAKARERTR